MKKPIVINNNNNNNHKKEERQTFRRVSEAHLSAQEGGQVLIHCEINNQEGIVQWSKNGAPVFINGTREEGPFERTELVGNQSMGVHNLLIKNLIKEDSGEYKCVVYGRQDDGHHLKATSELEVLARSTEAPISQSLDGNSNDTPQDSKSLTNEQLSANNAGKGSQLQARDIPNSFTKLTSLASTATSSSNSNGFVSPFSTTQQQQQQQQNSFNLSPHARHNSLTQPNGSAIYSSGAGNLLIIWPYLLMLFAAILFLANIWLIYSLIKRIRANNNSKNNTNNNPRQYQQHQQNLNINNSSLHLDEDLKPEQEQHQHLHHHHLHPQQNLEELQQQPPSLNYYPQEVQLQQQQQLLQPPLYNQSYSISHLQHHFHAHPHIHHLHSQYPHVTTCDGSDSTNSASTAEFGLSNSSPSQTITSIII